MTSIVLNTADTTAQINRLLDLARRPRALLAAGGREVRNQLVKHFRQKNRTEPNKLGGTRTNFWTQVSRSVQQPAIGDTAVTISINHPAFAQKVFGGPITAKRVRNLSIPLDREAYGRAPATFEKEIGLQLFFVKSSGKALLATAAEKGGLTVRYLLTPRVNQKPDPTALPAEGVLINSFLTRAQSVLDRQTP